MKNKTQSKPFIKDIKIRDEEVWKKLAYYKIRGGFKNMALVVRELLKNEK